MSHTQFNGYNAFFVPAHDILTTLLTLLAHASTSPVPEATILASRTNTTSQPLPYHAGVVALTVDRLVSRVCGVPSHGWIYRDTSLTTLAAVRERVEAALAMLRAADKDVVNQRCAEGMLMLPDDDAEGGQSEVPVHVYVSSFNLTYQWFHLVKVYDLLVMAGVEIGKEEFMVDFNKTLVGKPGLWSETK